MATVRIKLDRPVASGRRKGFNKHVTAVDQTKRTGYAFEGDFLPDNEEVDISVGALIIQKTPTGSVKNISWTWEFGRVKADGQVIFASRIYGRSEFLSFRDAVADALERERPTEELEIERERLISRIAKIDAILAQSSLKLG